MSGICGLAHGDGAPADGAILERMTTTMVGRGPDGRATWLGECAGLGHTLLRTDAPFGDEQPAKLDGRAWIVADVRLDGRAELRSTLEGLTRTFLANASDAELVLHAYAAWEEACIDHIRGDFAFAIWDAPRRRLFCARDHVGVKPFFYARIGAGIVFANTLDTVRAHPGVSGELDELAIADFLLFEMSQEPSATVFAAVRRLPPAHCLTLSPGGMRVRRYWRLGTAAIASYPRDEDYIGRFDELLTAAVADRVRGSSAAVLMSGGLDSPALASIASRRGADVRAFSSVYDHLIDDDERRYSTLAAAGLRIPISHRAADGYALFERYGEMRSYFSEPVNAPFAAVDVDLVADAAAHSRVVLTGWDGDTLLAESPRPFLRMLARERQWGSLAGMLARYAIDHPWHAARSVLLRLKPARRAVPAAPFWPAWLEASFVARLHLRERWNDAHFSAPPATDALRPLAHAVFEYLARLSTFFETSDPGRTGVAADVRHPYMDLRLVAFCLTLPPIPWCVRKEILRRWLRGRVPEEVRLRPKTPLAGFPHMEVLGRDDSAWLDGYELSADAGVFIDRGKMTSVRSATDPAMAWANLRPASLDLWLRHASRAGT